MLALDPRETFEVLVASEEGTPDATRSRFTFRYLSAREFRKVNALAGEYEALKALSSDQVLDRLTAALRVNLVGWCVREVDTESVPFDLEKLEDICTVSELWELFDAARRQSRLDGPEKNASGSPSPTSTDTLVEDAPAAPAAPTDPPTPSP